MKTYNQVKRLAEVLRNNPDQRITIEGIPMTSVAMSLTSSLNNAHPHIHRKPSQLKEVIAKRSCQK